MKLSRRLRVERTGKCASVTYSLSLELSSHSSDKEVYSSDICQLNTHPSLITLSSRLLYSPHVFSLAALLSRRNVSHSFFLCVLLVRGEVGPVIPIVEMGYGNVDFLPFRLPSSPSFKLS